METVNDKYRANYDKNMSIKRRKTLTAVGVFFGL